VAGPIALCPFCGGPLNEPLGALGFAGPTCPSCHRTANVIDHPYYGSVGAVEYDFDDVRPADRAAASDILVEAAVPYRWEDGFRLLVAPESEDQVDRLFGHAADDTEPAEVAGDGRGGDGRAAPAGSSDRHAPGGSFTAGPVGDDEPADWAADEEAVEALARLFDAADRLRHHPQDEDAGAELADAAGVVLVAPVPFAMNRVVWATAGMLARQLLDLVEGHAESEDIVAGADALRAVLRDHV
jgi:hypothetical protein